MTYHPPLATKRMTWAADTRRRFEAGETVAAIARAKKVTEETIRAHLREAGVGSHPDAEAGTPSGGGRCRCTPTAGPRGRSPRR
jgi:predicted transcriptional regulator